MPTAPPPHNPLQLHIPPYCVQQCTKDTYLRQAQPTWKSYSSVSADLARIFSCNSQPSSQHSFTIHRKPVQGRHLFLSSETLYCCKKQRLQSQNHRTVGAGRDLWRSLSPTPPPSQDRLHTAGCTVGIQLGLEYLQRRTIHNLPGQPDYIPPRP